MFLNLVGIFIDFLENLENFVANLRENLEIFQRDSQISFQFPTDFPNFLLKFPNFLLKFPNFLLKFPNFLLKFPNFLLKFRNFLSCSVLSCLLPVLSCSVL